MVENTKIEWATHTFNPWVGCQKVGPGCDHCYAETFDARFGGKRWGPHATRTRTRPANWSKVRAWNRAAVGATSRPRVFCASLADVFDNHASILPEWRADLGRLIVETPAMDWMLLTKRPGNAARYLAEMFPDGTPDHVWVGCTVVNQEEADRDIPKLLAVPARVRFLSMEPLLGPVGLTSWFYGPDYSCASCSEDGDCECGWQMRRDLPDDIAPGQLDLVIVGGESGPGARPMHPDWVRSLRDQCVGAGVAFHFKQWGNWSADALLYTDPEGRCPPPSMNIGKKAAGRMLDGRTWDEMPEGNHD